MDEAIQRDSRKIRYRAHETVVSRRTRQFAEICGEAFDIAWNRGAYRCPGRQGFGSKGRQKFGAVRAERISWCHVNHLTDLFVPVGFNATTRTGSKMHFHDRAWTDAPIIQPRTRPQRRTTAPGPR